MTQPMKKRARTEEDKDIEEFRQYPIHGPLEEMMNLHLNQFRQQEVRIQGKTHAVDSLIEHLENGTTPRSFPNMQFVTVKGTYQQEADDLTKNHMKAAYKSILEGLIDIRLREKRDEVNKKNIIFQEYTLQLTNALNSYHQAGALEKEELPIWIAKYKDWLTQRATREAKILKMKHLVLQEKKQAAVDKKKVAQAEVNVNDAMKIDESDTIKQLKAQVAKLMKNSERQTGKRKEPKHSLKLKAPGKKVHFQTGAKIVHQEQDPDPRQEQGKGRKKGRGGQEGQGNGKHKHPSRSERGTSPSGSAHKPSAQKRN